MNTPNADSRPNTGSIPKAEARRPLRTSDLAAASIAPSGHEEAEGQRTSTTVMRPSADDTLPSSTIEEQASTAAASAPERMSGAERLEALFPRDTTTEFRERWAEVQRGFVNDPRRAVAEGDELVAEVMRSLAQSFAHERERLEDELSHTGEASTETLRVGLRRYRSFFERLLAV